MTFDPKWEIDHSTGSPILVYDKCSVIQDEQAHYLLSLIQKDAPSGRRLWFISDRLGKFGYLNRSDICEAFKVSIPQASTDIKRWREKHPWAISYNKSRKRYEHILFRLTAEQKGGE